VATLHTVKVKNRYTVTLSVHRNPIPGSDTSRCRPRR
jgi:hypothetical protein